MADRTVKVKLTLDAKGFIAGLAAADAAAKKFRDGLGKSWEPWERENQRQKSRAPKDADEIAGAFSRNFSRRLESAFRQLPKAKIDADSSDAQIKLQTIRSSIQELAGKTIGVDINSSAALGELRALQFELERIDTGAEIDVRADAAAALGELYALQREVDKLGGETARVDVDVNSAAAQAGLRGVNSEVSRLDGRRANVSVNADVGRALANLALVGAALAALPSVATVAVGVGALGAAFTAAGAGAAGFAAAALPGLGRVNAALKEQETATGGAGGATKSLAQTQAEALSTALRLAEAHDRVKDAAQAVRDAQRGVSDAVRGVERAQADAAQAAQDAADRQAQAARRVEDAERGVADAHRATQRAVEDLTRARERAQERLEDLALATERGALSEERARIQVERAKADLAVTNSNKRATGLDKQDAALRLKEAEFALKEIKERNADVAKERADADAKGVEGSDEVTAAKDRLEAATRREQDAERSLSDARAAASREAVAGARAIADANQRVADAQRKVGDAQRQVIKAQRDAERAAMRLKIEQLQAKAATEQAGGAAGGAASKMSKLSDAEKALAEDIRKFKNAYLAWQKELQPDVFPVITKGMDLLTVAMSKSTPLVRASAGAFGELLDEAKQGLQGEQWTGFFNDLADKAPRLIEGLGHATGNVAGGLAGIVQAFLPYTGTMMGALEDLTQGFEDWGQGLGDSLEFKDFIAWVTEHGPDAWELLKNLAKAASNIVESLAPLGVGSMSGLNLLAKLLAGMDPEQIQAIAVGILAIKGAQAGMQVAAAWGNLTGKISGLSGVLKGGAVALALAGVATAVGEIDQELSGLNPNIHTLADNLGSFVKGGPATADVLDQIQGKIGLIDKRGLEDIGSVLERLTSDNLLDELDSQMGEFANNLGGPVGLVFDHSRERIKNLDQAMATMVASGNTQGAAALFNGITQQAREAGTPLSALKDLFPEYTSAAGGAVLPTQNAANAIDDAKKKLDDFQKSLDVFAGRTDAMQALRNMETAFKDAKQAINDANGKLSINAGMTDKQKDAVIRAREQFSGYLQRVKDGADAQKTLSGKTFDATKTIVDQLPKMFELAGKNREAREQVLLLAKAYGISREDALKAANGGKSLKEVLDKIKSKDIRVGLDTSKAKEALNNLIRSVSSAVANIAVSLTKKKRAGGIEAYAAGGLRSTAPFTATSPTILMGEGTDKEAFIPYERQYRQRAMSLVTQVASDFGMIRRGSGQSTALGGSFGAGAAGRAIAVSVDGLEPLRVSMDATAQALSQSLGSAVSVLSSSVGDSGSLTSAVDGLGEAAGDLGGLMLDAVRGLAGQIKALDASIDALSAAVSASRTAASSSAASSSAKKTSTATVGASARKSTAAKKTSAKKAAAKPKTTAKQKVPIVGSGAGPSKPKSQGVFIEPAEPMALGGLVKSPTILAGEAGKEMVIPLEASKRARGLQLLEEAAAFMGRTTVPSVAAAPGVAPMFRKAQASTPPRYVTGGQSAGTGPLAIDEQFMRRLEAALASRPALNVENLNVPAGTSEDGIADRLLFKARL